MYFNNIAFSVFGIDIYWYGINYAISFLIGYLFLSYFGKFFLNDFNKKKEIYENIYFYTIIIGLIGGRIFHIIFYQPIYYFNNPKEIFMFWHGGMSIHGGIIFSMISLYYFSKKYKFSFFSFTDLLVIPLSFALSIGRVTNFINQELVGEITNSNIGIVFPKIDNYKRFPSQLFESFKNILVFEILTYSFFIKNFYKKKGLLTALFLILYNGGRFICDFFREPEVLLFNFISMSQFQSLVFLFLGIFILIKINK